MTTIKERANSKDRSIIFNRTMYGAFLLLSIYFLLGSKDVASAMANLGIALIFDPFDQKITWKNRPLYQRAWLFVHVGIVLSMTFYLILTSLQPL